MIARKWSLNGNGKQKRVQTLENGEEENAKKELIGYLFQYQMNVIKTLKFRSWLIKAFYQKDYGLNP